VKILTFDIGGANTKKLLYDAGNILKNEIHYFPFWREWKSFPDFLSKLKEDASEVGFVFTAELSDAFRSKTEGIEFLLEVCSSIFPGARFMDIDKRLLRVEEVKEPLNLAAANYAASVYYLERQFGGGILLDIGSTTTDIIPFRRGERLYAKTDLERMLDGQLLYQGCLRTSLSALAQEIPFRGSKIKPASELFAITADIYIILGEIESYNCETPDGRGKGVRESMQRVARMLCSDIGEVKEEEIVEVCRAFRETQVESIAASLRKVRRKYGLEKVFIAGIGDFLGEEVCKRLGMEYKLLKEETEAYNNLPCLGIAEALTHESD